MKGSPVTFYSLQRRRKESGEGGGTEGPPETEASKKRDRIDVGLTASDVLSRMLGLR